MNNYWFTDCPASQEGEVLLRYAVRAAVERDDAASARPGREHRCRARGGDVTWLDKADTAPRLLPSAGASLLALDVPDGVVVTLHHPRTGRGMGLRLQETAGRVTSVDLAAAVREGETLMTCTALDDPVGVVEGRVIELSPFAVRSLMVVPTTATQHAP